MSDLAPAEKDLVITMAAEQAVVALCRSTLRSRLPVIEAETYFPTVEEARAWAEDALATSPEEFRSIIDVTADGGA